jgi:uncharacterized membrane protein
MTDFGLFTLFLFVHVLTAIIAFGPAFIFPLIGAMGGNEPMHGNFALRIAEAIEDKVVLPAALTMPISGLLIIWFAHINLFDRTSAWLVLGIVLYIVALYIAVFRQRPTVHKMVELTSGPPPAGAPAGPPPGFLDLARQVRINGMALTVLIVVIVLLMTTRPQFLG